MFKNALFITLSLVLVLSTACSLLPVTPGTVSVPALASQSPHVRRLQTTGYVGDHGAIIFTVAHSGDNTTKDATDNIIRIFAENKVPLDIAVTPSKDGDYSNYMFLGPYVDAGLIDISINGNMLGWLDADTPRTDAAYINLLSELQQSRDKLKFLFGDTPVACLFPSRYLDETNYTLVQDAGFRVLSTPYETDFHTSIEPMGWSGKIEPNGLFRLPVVDIVDYTAPVNSRIPASLRADTDNKLLADVKKSTDDLGIAVIEIQPGAFIAGDKTPDSSRLTQLTNLLKACQKLGDVTTFEDWFTYTSRWATGNPGIKRVMPPYNGGRAIIFRMDDVSVGWHEDVDEAIIQLFQKNGVPVDVGVVSNVEGTNSYEMPWLKKYLEQGVIGINVHGYDWTYYQFDTTEAYKYSDTEACYLPGAADQPETPKEKLTYAYIKFKLLTARDQYLQYFGVKPIALTVPTDYFDETGYRAIQDAGFKVFSTMISNDPHPSIVLVDYAGRKDPNGMYRIPTAEDVCLWENCTWGDVIDISNIMAINGYCQYHAAWDEVVTNDFGAMLCGLLGTQGVAAVSIHPDAFVGMDGKPNQEKLQKLDAIIKWCKTVATITTFEQWYNYTSSIK
jgi:hypothetical protein